MQRRDFIVGIGCTAVTAWPFGGQAQQRPLPVIGFVGSGGEFGESVRAALARGLAEQGLGAGRNVEIFAVSLGRMVRPASSASRRL